MKKKILFFGTPEIAVPSLETIAHLQAYEIVGVGVFPDRKVGRKQIPTPCPVKVKALEIGLPIFEIDSKHELKTLFENVECDLAIVIAFGLIFPKSVLNKPPFGVVNVHFSLLPAYRGASPVQAAIIDGLETSGITWQKMVPALDAGDILWQTTHSIKDQTTLKVWTNFAQFTAAAFPTFLDAYFKQTLTGKAQLESETTFCGKFEKQDGFVSATDNSAEEIYNRWRAFQPWPGVNLKTKHGPLKLIEISLQPSGKPESLLNCKNQTALYIQVAQIPGKKPQSITAIMAQKPNLLEP